MINSLSRLESCRFRYKISGYITDLDDTSDFVSFRVQSLQSTVHEIKRILLLYLFTLFLLLKSVVQIFLIRYILLNIFRNTE